MQERGRVQGVELGELRQDEIPAAARMAAGGMRDNPSSVALLGYDSVRRERDLRPVFEWLLRSMSRPSLVARRRELIVGIAAMSSPDACFLRQSAAREYTLGMADARMRVSVPAIPWRLVPHLLRLGPRALNRLSAWGEVAVDHDPRQRHNHIELVVVHPAMQGLGIGGILMDRLCAEVDSLPDPAYLETDTAANVRWYESYGFEVTAQATVLGASMRYMSRSPGASGSRERGR